MMDKTVYIKCFSVILTFALAYLQPILGIGETEENDHPRLKIWEVQDVCGETVAIDEYAGQIQLTNYHSFPYKYNERRPKICEITVLPKYLPKGYYYSKVLLYFTEFKFPTVLDSSTLNVSIKDGKLSDDRPLKGTLDAFSGVYNYSFSHPGPVYNTTKDRFTLVIRWKDDLDFDYDLKGGGFILKFAAYYSEPCGYETTTCANKRCVSKIFHCHPDIDVCGGGEEQVCDPKLDEKFWTEFADNIWKSIEKVLFWVLIIAGIVIILRVVKRLRQQHGGFRQMFSNIIGAGSSQANRNTYTPPNETSLEMNRRYSANFEPARPHVFDDDNEIMNPAPPGAQNGAPPAYDSLPPQSISSTTPLPPPPSYEEFQREEHKYKFEPNEPKPS